jgi:hypothetical protein
MHEVVFLSEKSGYIMGGRVLGESSENTWIRRRKGIGGK